MKRSTIVFSTFILLIALFTFSCEEKKESKPLTKAKADSMKLKADSLDHNVKAKWATLTQNQDQIFADIKRLLDEVSYTNSYDVRKHQELLDELKAVQMRQLKPEEVSDSIKVDNFDLALDSLVVRVTALANETPNIEAHPLANELINDIYENNSNKIVMLRLDYDDAVTEYNDFVLVNKELLETLGKPYSEWDIKETFMPPADLES